MDVENVWVSCAASIEFREYSLPTAARYGTTATWSANTIDHTTTPGCGLR